MSEERTELRVINPRGEAEKNPLMPPSPRLKDLMGKKIGIIRIRIQAGEVLFPYLEEALKDRTPDTQWDILEMLFIEDAEERAARLKEMITPYDGIVISLAVSGRKHNQVNTPRSRNRKAG